MKLQPKGTGTYGCDSAVVQLGEREVRFLKDNLAGQPLRRVRICAHQENTDTLHEMLILLGEGSFVRPHKHLGKNESFHIVEGAVDVVIFDDEGCVSEVVEMGAYGSGRSFFYRLNTPSYHTLLIHGGDLVVHETTNGPFVRDNAVFAPWAPDGTDPDAVAQYLRKLKEETAAFFAKKTQQ